MIAGDELNRVRRAKYERHAGVDGARHNVKDRMYAIGRPSSRAFDDKCNRIGFVKKPKAPVFITGPLIAGVKKNATP